MKEFWRYFDSVLNHCLVTALIVLLTVFLANFAKAVATIAEVNEVIEESIPEPNEVDDVFCDVCGESLTEYNFDGSRETWSGLSFSYSFSYSEQGQPHKELRRLKTTFGKTKFDICGVCFMKALGVKPIKEK